MSSLVKYDCPYCHRVSTIGDRHGHEDCHRGSTPSSKNLWENRKKFSDKQSAINEEKAQVPPVLECEMCQGEHHTIDCADLASFRPPVAHTNDDGSIIYMKDGVIYDYDILPYPSSVCNLCFQEHNLSDDCSYCPICYQDHSNCCSYYGSVPKDAVVSPFFRMMCSQCDGTLDSSLWCKRCNKSVNGYVDHRRDCFVCGKAWSSTCCPYGTRVGEKFRESHSELTDWV